MRDWRVHHSGKFYPGHVTKKDVLKDMDNSILFIEQHTRDGDPSFDGFYTNKLKTIKERRERLLKSMESEGIEIDGE